MTYPGSNVYSGLCTADSLSLHSQSLISTLTVGKPCGRVLLLIESALRVELAATSGGYSPALSLVDSVDYSLPPGVATSLITCNQPEKYIAP